MSSSPSSTELAGRRIVLGLSGGIACYKSAELVRELIKAGATVQVVMTEAAEQFITAVTLQALSNRPVFTSQWDPREANNMAHINLTREADAVLVAPASADFVAKLVHGRADDLLSLLCLARPIERCPLLVAPAMNREMWAHPATQRNVAQLEADGATLLGPGSGDQACGEVGDGRMLEPSELRDELIAFFQPKVLAGKRVLVTAGPTFEPIDPVRGLTNRSSGKMGFAIARAAAEAGAEVTLVAGPVASGDTAARPPRRRHHGGRDVRGRARRRGRERCFHRHRRRRRLAHGECRHGQDQEDRGLARCRRSNWSKTPTSWRPWPDCLDRPIASGSRRKARTCWSTRTPSSWPRTCRSSSPTSALPPSARTTTS